MSEGYLEHEYGLSALWHLGWQIALFPSMAVAVYAEFRYLRNASNSEIVALTDFRLGTFFRILAASVFPSVLNFYFLALELPFSFLVEWLVFAWMTFLMVLLLRLEQTRSDMMPRYIFSFRYNLCTSFMYAGYICSFYWVKATMQFYE